MNSESDAALELARTFREALRQAVYVTRRLDVGETELTGSQLSLLTQLADGGARVSDIARNLGVRAPTATEQITRLEGRGYVRRDSDPEDSRAVVVRLTDDGWDAVARVNLRRNRAIAAVIDELPPRDREALEAAIPVLTSIYDRLRGE
ncbi:MarR family winged helix-turn-helix transcriptional regulator [Arthrobacter woluwensis]|uniref:DNA-binding transcriptional regulator, MarR family n=1 Tax=Arthrobacter woluwensis TaxID=156980 RepID=A0A1H4KB22_9MICC|nr:MarR family transcriptional regulator [Arthrobacter woluwensis]SEB55228.1 DNA-binding transcriptional regulator, MarR family [Arthrobacter woluwensis]